VTVLAAALSFSALSAPSFWYDEAASLAFASLDWSTFAHALAHMDAEIGLY
jgi:hypothetical protein